MLPLELTGRARHLELTGAVVSGDFFDTLGVLALCGRTLHSGDAGEVVVGARLSEQLFGETCGALGSAVDINGRGFRVVGVLPASFAFPNGSQLWLPGETPGDVVDIANVGDSWENAPVVVARLQRGQTIETAERALASALPDLREPHIKGSPEVQLHLLPLLAAVVGDRRAVLGSLLAASWLVLTGAWAVLAILAFARGSEFLPEIGTRICLGATPARAVRPLIIELGLLSGLGLLGALIFGAAASRELRAYLPLPPGLGRPPSDWTVLCYVTAAAGVSIAVPLLAALRATRVPPAVLLRCAAGTLTPSRDRAHIVALLMVPIYAVSILIGATALGALGRAWAERTAVLGWQPQGVWVFSIDMNRRAGWKPPNRPTSYDQLVADMARRAISSLRLIEKQPGVIAAGFSAFSPFSPRWLPADSVNYDGEVWQGPGLNATAVSPGYFAALGIRVIRGRTFSPMECVNSANVAIVDSSFGRFLGPGRNPVGHIIRVNDGPPMRIVGEVAVARLAPQDASIPRMYWTYPEIGMRSESLLIRTHGGTPPPLEAIGRALGIPAGGLRAESGPQVIAIELGEVRARVLVLTFLAGLTGLLVMAGALAAGAYLVRFHARAYAIRLALGASPAQVAAGLSRENGRILAVGVAMGWLVALLFGVIADGRPIAGSLPGVGALLAATCALSLAALPIPLLAARRALHEYQGGRFLAE